MKSITINQNQIKSVGCEIPVGSRVRLITRIKERALGSIGIVKEVLNPTIIVEWEQELPGVLSWTELLPEFIEIISQPTCESGNQESNAIASKSDNNKQQAIACEYQDKKVIKELEKDNLKSF